MAYFSFVLPCFNNWNLSEQAINTLIKSLDSEILLKGVELIIVNNGSIDATREGIQEIQEKYHQTVIIKTLHFNENIGYPAAVTFGLSECNGEIITILSNDLVFVEGWFNSLVDVLEREKTVGIAAPYLSYSSGLQNVGIKLNSVDEIINYAQQFMKENKSKVTYTYRVIGDCMSFKRKVLNLIGGPDFWFGPITHEDDDWCIRTRVSGYKIAIVGGAFVYHIGSVTVNQDQSTLQSCFAVNSHKYFRKWGIGGFNEIEMMIQNTAYTREKHFLPTKKEEFDLTVSPLVTNIEDKRKILLAANWSNTMSQWKNKLFSTINTIDPNDIIYFWVPNQYFVYPDSL